MKTEIITTGTELLLGEIANEDSRYLAQLLNRYGYSVLYMTTVGDNPKRMREAFETALSRVDVVITSGGLGATLGDITKKAGADAMGLSFEKNEEEEAHLRAYYAARKRPWMEALGRQAWFAKGADILKNHVGSAAGSAVLHGGKCLIHLPGPPDELKSMAENEMIPWMQNHLGSQGVICSSELSVPHAFENVLEEKLADLVKAQTNPTIAFYARPGYVAIRLTAKGETEGDAKGKLISLQREIESRVPVICYNLEEEAQTELVHLLETKHLTLAAAESCTGGLIGKLMTDRPGSSVYFMGSAVTYQNSAKEKILGVSADTLAKYTAVSEETAKEMAEGARALYDSDVAVATTGYAGPGKGERGEPEGTVYIAVSGKSGTKVYKEQFRGSRKNVRYAAAHKAIFYAAEYIRDVFGEEDN